MTPQDRRHDHSTGMTTMDDGTLHKALKQRTDQLIHSSYWFHSLSLEGLMCQADEHMDGLLDLLMGDGSHTTMIGHQNSSGIDTKHLKSTIDKLTAILELSADKTRQQQQ